MTAPASYNEYQNIRQQLEVETVPGANPGDPPRPYHTLPPQEQARMSKKRLSGFSFSLISSQYMLSFYYITL